MPIRVVLLTLSGLLSLIFCSGFNPTYAEIDQRFIGLRHVPAAEVRQVLPEAAKRPTFLDFSSPMCLDCQKMKPVLKQFRAEHPEVYFKAVDVNTDQRTQAAVLRAFKPMTVPALVVINSRGEISDVLYNFQPLTRLNTALKSIQAAPSAMKAPLKKKS